MSQIILICTANICRSPVAEALLRAKLQALGLTHWRVSSAGTWAQNGLRPSTFSVEVLAERHDLDISRHRSREVTADILAPATLVLCMTASHAEALQLDFPEYAHKVQRLTDLTGSGYDISDPYGHPKEDYVRMVDEVAAVVTAALPRILELATPEKH